MEIFGDWGWETLKSIARRGELVQWDVLLQGCSPTGSMSTAKSKGFHDLRLGRVSGRT